MTKPFLILFICLLLSACMSSPPKNTANVCAVFDEKSSWYKHARKASKRWNVPIAVNMAFMQQESSFVAKAKPPRKKILGFIPGPRPSSSYGYSQAKDETWRWYKKQSGHRGADRNDFDDAIDFIAWYNRYSADTLGIANNDAYRLYLAYHEGHGGFKKGSFKNKEWLIQIAKKVSRRATQYQSQLKKCEKRLRRSWWPF
jgi:hypothetical protein